MFYTVTIMATLDDIYLNVIVTYYWILQVGLAVGDVDRLQKTANENRIGLQVSIVILIMYVQSNVYKLSLQLYTITYSKQTSGAFRQAFILTLATSYPAFTHFTSRC